MTSVLLWLDYLPGLGLEDPTTFCLHHRDHLSSDIDNAVDSMIDPAGITDNEEDKYKCWKRSEPIAERHSHNAQNPIHY
jgi:hypothetical protein